MNEDALSPADASRRDVLVGGLIATVAAGLRRPRWPAKLLKHATLKVYESFPHGMCTTHADTVNPDLLAFIKR